MAAKNDSQWKPDAGDALFPEMILGANGGAAPWDFKIMKGCALTVNGGDNKLLDIASGRVKCGGFLVEYTGTSYDPPITGGISYLYFKLTVTRETDATLANWNKVIGFSYDFEVNGADAVSDPANDDVYYFKVAEITTDGADAITLINRGESAAWYARPIIPIGTTGWISNDVANPVVVSVSSGTFSCAANTEVSKDFAIPFGMTATRILITGNAVRSLNVDKHTMSGSMLTGIDGGPGAVNTAIDLTDTDSDSEVLIRPHIVNVAGALIYGGKITLELIAA